MKTLYAGLIASAAVLALAGCAAQSPDDALSDDGYQFGDVSKHVTGTLHEQQAEYCAAADPTRRAVLLAVIRTRYPLYPESGLCTDAEEAVAGRLIHELSELPDVDVERAVRDQERARERTQQ